VLCDTHAHLDFRDFDNDRDAVVRRAEKAGVSCILNPGCDLETSHKAVELAKTYGSVYAAVGIHPNSTSLVSPEDFREIERLARAKRVVALGETGLDFYRNRSPRKVQLRSFAGHLDFARESGLPVIVHFRNVGYEGIELVGIGKLQGLRGVFHCFSGSLEFARKLVSMGFFIGFDGPLTYKNSAGIEIARAIPLEHCLLETDAPFLTPQSRRGARNEPAYLVEIAEKMAQIKNCDVGEVIAVTGRNATELFGIPVS
jgi:TatD DNase family protein